ncbi:MAG: GNAT family protein [Pseudomonadota bacterium]
MSDSINSFGQPVGLSIKNWIAPSFPAVKKINGHWCVIEPLDVLRHGLSLFESNGLDADDKSWTYLVYGPFKYYEDYEEFLTKLINTPNSLSFAVIDKKTDKAIGIIVYDVIEPHNGSLEIGNIKFSSLLKQTTIATEALYLLIKEAFSLGYRRIQWRCNSLNIASRKAAQRLGFSYEGLFRQTTISKGFNRDTAWYSLIDQDWLELRVAFEQWLNLNNFDENGKQKIRLSALTLPLLKAQG